MIERKSFCWGTFAVCVRFWLVTAAVAVFVSSMASQAKADLLGCFRSVESAKDLEAQFLKKGYSDFDARDTKLATTSIGTVLRMDTKTIKAWKSKVGLIAVSAKAQVFDGEKWIFAQVCLEQADGAQYALGTQTKEWSGLYRRLLAQKDNNQFCCWSLPGYSKYLTVFHEIGLSDGQEIVQTEVIPRHKISWSRYTVIHSDGFNNQFRKQD